MSRPFPNARCSVLLVDDEPAILALLAHQLSGEFDLFTACSVSQAKQVFRSRPIDIILTDLGLSDGSGLELLEWARRTHPKTARVVLSGTTRLSDAVDAVNRCQVLRLVLKPWKTEDLIGTLQAVARSVELERSHERLLDDYRRLLQQLEDRVAERTRELEHKNQLLEKMALTDALTGVPNRRAVELIARKELLRRTRTGEPMALGLIDADHFKRINSRHLLVGGDHVLIWLGQTLQGCIRGADSLGRIGGEEFMVVAPNTDVAGAEVLAERLRSVVEQTGTEYNGDRIRMTVSLGFAIVEGGITIGYDELRTTAASALGLAKSAGRNQSVVVSVPKTPTRVRT